MGFHLFDDNEEMDFISGNNRDDLQIGQYNQNFKLNPNIQPELENVTEKYQYPADVALPFVLAGGTADSPVAGQLANSIAQNKVKKESEIWQELKDRYEYENLEDNMKMSVWDLMSGGLAPGGAKPGDVQYGVWLMAGLDALFQTYGPSGKWSVIASGANALVPGQIMKVGRSQAYLRDLKQYDKMLRDGYTPSQAQANLQIDISATEVEDIGKETNLIGDMKKHIDMMREANQMGGEPVLWNMMRQVINGKPVNFDRGTLFTLESVKAEDTPYWNDLVTDYGMSPAEARKFIYNKIGEPLKQFDENGAIHYTSAFNPNKINFYAGRSRQKFMFMGDNMQQDLYSPEWADKNILLEYSPGKVLTAEIFEPGTRAFDLMSGTIDATYQILPEIFAGKGLKGMRNLKKGFRRLNQGMEATQDLGIVRKSLFTKKTKDTIKISPRAVAKKLADDIADEADPFTGKGNFDKFINTKTGKYKELDDITPTYKDLKKGVKKIKAEHTAFGRVPRFFQLTKKQILDQPIMDEFFGLMSKTTVDDLDVIATNPILGKLPGEVQLAIAETTEKRQVRKIVSDMMDTGYSIADSSGVKKSYKLSEYYADGALPVRGSFVLNKLLQETAVKGTKLQQSKGIYSKAAGSVLSAIGNEKAAYKSFGSYLGAGTRKARVAIDNTIGMVPGISGLSRQRKARKLQVIDDVAFDNATIDTMDSAGSLIKQQQIADTLGLGKLEFEKYLGFSSNFNSTFNPYYRKLLGVIPDMGIPLNNASVGYRQLVSHMQINGYGSADMSKRLKAFIDIDYSDKQAIRKFADQQAEFDLALVEKRGGDWEYVAKAAREMFEGQQKSKMYALMKDKKILPNVGSGWEMRTIKAPDGSAVDMPMMTGSMFSEMADNIAPLMDYKILQRAMGRMFKSYDTDNIRPGEIFSKNVKDTMDYGKYKFRKVLGDDDVSLVNPFEKGVISVKKLEDDYVTNLFSFYTRNVFKPLVLMRAAFFTRVFLEEQARIATAGLSAFYNHPFKTMQWLAAHNPNSKVGKFLDKLPLQKVTGAQDGVELMQSMEAMEAARFFKLSEMIGPGAAKRNKYTEYIAKTKQELGTEKYSKHIFYELMFLRNDPIAKNVAKYGYGSPELKKWIASDAGRQARMELFDAGGNKWQEILKKDSDFLDQHLQYLESRIRIKSGGNVTIGTDLIKRQDGTYRYNLKTSDLGDADIRRAISDGKLKTKGEGKFKGVDLDFYENEDKVFKNFRMNKVIDALGEIYDDAGLDGGAVKVTRNLLDDADKGFLQKTEEIMNIAQQAIFDRLMTRPINYLNRSPVFKQYRWMYVSNKFKELTPTLQKKFIKEATGAAIPNSVISELKGLSTIHRKGKIADYDAINVESKAYGLAMVKNLLYDTRQKHALSDKALNIFPFAEVWFEVFQTWGQLLSANPTVLRKAHVGLRGGTSADSFGRSSDDGFITPDPRNPERDMFVMPFGGWMSNIIYGEDSETMISPRGYLQGVNLLGQGFVPGPNPMVGFAINRLLPENTSNPVVNDAANWIRESLYGDFGPPEEARDILAVAPVYKKLRAALVNPEEFENIVDDSSEIHRMRASATIDVFRYGMASGQNKKLYDGGKLNSYLNKLYPNNWSPKTITQKQIDEAYLEYSKDASGRLFLMEFLYQFIGPTGFKPEYFMKDDVGNLWGTAVLYEEFVRIREQNQGNDIATYNEFFELYGIEHPYILSPKSQSETGRKPSSVRVQQFQAENKEVFDQLKLSGYYLNMDNPNEEKDYQDIIREKSLLSPDQYRRAVNDTLGFFRYKTFTTSLEKLDNIDYKKKTMLKRFFREQLKEALPGFQADEYGLMTPVATKEVFDEMRDKWGNISFVQEQEAGKGFTEIMPFWEEMERLSMEYSPTKSVDWWLKSDDSTALSMRIWMYNKAQQIIAEYPEFWGVWNGVMLKLYRDDFEVLDYIPER